MKNFIIIDINKDGSGNIVLGEYESQGRRRKSAKDIKLLIVPEGIEICFSLF